MSSRGRPTKFTDEVKEKLLQAIRDGNYWQAACGVAGVDYTTVRKWITLGTLAQKGKFFDFFNAIKDAEAEAEARAVKQWQTQMPNNWQAARDYLERRFSDRWGRRDKLVAEHTGAGGGPIETVNHSGVDFSSVTDEELDKELERLEKLRRANAATIDKRTKH